MHYVYENQYAFDAGSLGFPSILGCQAICFHTSRGLYGFHDAKSGARLGMSAADVSNAKLAEFAGWVQGEMQAGETGTALIGVINQGEQYTASTAGNAEWKAVLTGLATSLGFAGDIRGARVSSHVESGGSIYVQFDVAGNDCAVGFKRWSKLDSDHQHKVQPTSQGRVIWDKGASSYGAAPLYGSGTVAPVVRKNTNKGLNLNKIATKKFLTFA